MPSFLIIEAEALKGVKPGRGARGKNLEDFLKTYYGSRSVSMTSVNKLSGQISYCTDHLFIGIPSSITKSDLKKISFKNLHLFDYGDNKGIIWGQSDKEFLCSITKSYLKTWTQNNWGEEFNWGTLPIRRNRSLALSVKWNNLFNRAHNLSRIRPTDTTFLGNPVVNWKENFSSVLKNTRVQWLEEISAQEKYSFSGGFFMRNEEAKGLKEQAPDSLKPFFLEKGRLNFFSYFNLMLNSKTALTPPGNALWSYRHYESLYAGTIPITGSFRNTEMLIPLPLSGMIHLVEGESIIHGIEKALKMRNDRPNVTCDNLDFIECYLSNGLYDRRKKRLIARFMTQIERN